MLLISISILFAFLPCLGFGFLLSRLLYKQEVGLFQVFLTGLCGLLWLVQCISFFAPVNSWLHSILFVLAITPVFQYRKRLSVLSGKSSLVLFSMLAVFVVLMGLPIPHHSDSQFYHAQAVQWAAQYPVVPGLGNLFGRLAFNSSWFVGQATFSLSPWVQGTPYTLNLLLFFIWAAYLLKRLIEPKIITQTALLDAGFLFITLFCIRGWLSSPAPDVAVCMYMLICCRTIIGHLLLGELVNSRFLVLLLATAITIKVSAGLLAPLLILVPGLWLRKKWLHYVGFGFLILLPWLVRNYILSGYIIYPFLELDFLHPDWKVSLQQAEAEAGWIKSWARHMGPEYYYVGNQPVWEWFRHWLVNRTFLNQLLLSATAGLLLFQLLKVLIKRKASRPELLALLFIVPICVWLCSAPDLRFGYGVLLPCLLLLLLLILPKLNIPLSPRYLAISFILLLGFRTYTVLAFDHLFETKYILLPPPFPEADTRQITIDGILISIPNWEGNCYNHPIPCVNESLIPHNITARGKCLEDGFRLE